MENCFGVKANGGSSGNTPLFQSWKIGVKKIPHSQTKHLASAAAQPATNTGWTVAGMAAQSAGTSAEKNDHNALGEFKVLARRL